MKAGPCYVLKPLQTNDRGFKEIAFYEAVAVANEKPLCTQYSSMDKKIYSLKVFQKWQALHMHDKNNFVHSRSDVIIEQQKQLQQMKYEIDLIKRLSNFTSKYFGLIQIEKQPQAVSTNIIPDLMSATDSNQIHLMKKKIINNNTSEASCYMILDDLTHDFSKPCVLDIKMGLQTYEPDAHPSKIKREQKKYPMQNVFGFRIVGMKKFVYEHQPNSFLENGKTPTTTNNTLKNDSVHHSPGETFCGEYQTLDKYFGYSLDKKEKLLRAFRKFFLPSTPYHTTNSCQDNKIMMSPTMIKKIMFQRQTMVSNLLMTLLSIEKWFEDNNAFAFISSSLLVVYEGDMIVSTNTSKVTKPRLHMIDFCHVRRQKGGDPGYLHGINTLIELWKTILKDQVEQAFDVFPNLVVV